jgi:hypothetical protein
LQGTYAGSGLDETKKKTKTSGWKVRLFRLEQENPSICQILGMKGDDITFPTSFTN